MTLKTASVLAFERKLDTSDALFFSGDWSDKDNITSWDAVAIHEKSVRGVISNRLKDKDKNNDAKLDNEIESPNLQTVDAATLPHNHDTLAVKFTLRVLGGVGQPSACNNADYQTKLAQTISSYVDSNGFQELGMRYATNLANGRFLWRNRLGAEELDIRVDKIENGAAEKSWAFDGFGVSIRDFATASHEVAELGNTIASGLSGDGYTLLSITAFVRAGAAQEVFPSQELILEKAKGDKSKTLYQVNGIAGMHSQKISNALRSIDDWYPESETNGPIAVEPYGSVTSQGKAYRQPKNKQDFYSLLDAWVLKDKAPELEQQHFVIAMLIRGGVFGEKG